MQTLPSKEKQSGGESGWRPHPGLRLTPTGRNPGLLFRLLVFPCSQCLLPSLFFFLVRMSSNSSCFYCSPKTLGCSVGITKTEIQSVFFSGLRGSGTTGVFVIFSHYWSPARAPGGTQSIWNHPIGRWN